MGAKLIQEMSKDLITILSTDSLELAYAKMVKNEIRHLPVLDQTGAIVGIISDRDLQRSLKSTISGAGEFRFESCEFNSSHRVSDYMSWPVKFVDQNESVKIACERMIAEKISAFLVTDKNLVKGIVTTEDMLKLLARLLNGPSKAGIRNSIDELITNPSIGYFAQSLANMGI